MHRDIRPENVLLAQDGRALLTGFGLGGPAAGATRCPAPEQIRGEPATASTDVYGFAAMAFECLTGSAPCEGRRELPAALDAVVARGMAVAAEDRHARAGELVAALRTALEPVPPAGATEAVTASARAAQIRLLGPVEATVGGRRIPLGAAKQRAVLAMLALQPNAAVSIDALVDGLWGHDPPATSPKMVQTYVSQLRRLLEDADAEILTIGRGYALEIAPDGVDAGRLERLVEQGSGSEALALWRGAALADVAEEPFAAAEILRLEELRLRAAELAIDADLAAGRHAEVVGRLGRFAAEHPLREGFHARRMLALYRSGRQAEALAAYREARLRLVEEVGVEPGAELRELHERMLRQDPTLAFTPPRRPAQRAGAADAEGMPRSLPAVSRRRSVALAAAALLLGGAVFGVTRLTGSDGPSRIDEGAVGVIDPGDPSITTQYGLGREAGALAAGDGSVWVAHPSQGTVSRIRPGENRVDVIDVGPAPAGLAFGSGSLWVAGEEDGRLAQVDAETNKVRQRIRIGNGLKAVAFGFGAVWAAAATDGVVRRVDVSGRAGEPIPVGGHPAALATGAGSVWAAAEEAGTVVRIDPTGRIVGAIAVGNGPSAIAVGAGAVWVANRQDATVSRIDPDTDRVTHTLPAGRAPVALAVAAGALWIGDAGGEIRRLDPRAQAITATIETGSAPGGLVAVDDELWASGEPSLTAHRGGTLRVAGPGPVGVDPALDGFNGHSLPYAALLYDGLVAQRRAGGAAAAQIVPGLATAVPASDRGGTRYLFRLRRGLRYSDGTPVRASDFPASMRRLLGLAGDVAPLYESIAGVASCARKPARCDLSRGIRADDRTRTIELRLRRPDPELLRRLGFVLAAIVPASAATPTPDRPPPGTGPYRVERLVPGHSIAFVRNPHFRERDGRPAGFPDRIVFTMSRDAGAQAAAVERNALDLYQPFVLAPEELASLRGRLAGRLRSSPAAATVFAFLNVKAAPFDDVRVRQAINLSVDRARLETLAGGPETAAPTCQVLPPGMAGYQPVCPFTVRPTEAGAWVAPDTEKAVRLVAASGRRGTPVAVWTTPERQALARHLAAVLRRLGLPARVRRFDDVGGLFAAAQDPRERPQLGVIGWNAEHPGPERFLRDLVTCEAAAPGGTNLSGFCDPALDRAIDRAAAAGEQAGESWAELERRIAAAAPLLPLYSARLPVATSQRAGNVQSDPVTGVLVEQMWVR